MENGQPVFYRTFPEPDVEMNAVDDDNVRITLTVEDNGNAMGQVYFKRLFMELTIDYRIYRETHYLNYRICVPEDVCLRTSGHLGDCVQNQGSTEPGVDERESKSFSLSAIALAI